MPERKLTEKDVAAAVIEWLERAGWEVFQEVQVTQYGRIADIVAMRGGTSWMIEAKTNLTLQLLEQGHYWTAWASRSSIAFPAVEKGEGGTKRARWFAEQICRTLGIGMLELTHRDYETTALGPDGKITLEEILIPKEKPAAPNDIKQYLRERHKHYAQAGSAGHDHWTPFKETRDKAIAFIQAHPGCTMTELIAGIDHHYRSRGDARKNLLKWITRGALGNVRLEDTPAGKDFKLTLVAAEPRPGKRGAADL